MPTGTAYDVEVLVVNAADFGVSQTRERVFLVGARDGLPLFGWRRCFWNFLLKHAKDRPSWTLTAQPGPATGPFHWRSRRLAMRELCRLQTFPDEFVVHCDLASVSEFRPFSG